MAKHHPGFGDKLDKLLAKKADILQWVPFSIDVPHPTIPDAVYVGFFGEPALFPVEFRAIADSRYGKLHLKLRFRATYGEVFTLRIPGQYDGDAVLTGINPQS